MTQIKVTITTMEGEVLDQIVVQDEFNEPNGLAREVVNAIEAKLEVIGE